MAIKTDVQLSTDANVIKNETVAGANTANRIGTLLSDISDSKINVSSANGGLFTALSTNAWDFTTGTKRKIILAANTAITISGSVAGQSLAILSVTQDATGSRTLSIGGTSIAINTAANSNTLVAIVDLGGGLFAFDNNVVIAGGVVVTPPPAGSTVEAVVWANFLNTVADATAGTLDGGSGTPAGATATKKLATNGYVEFNLGTDSNGLVLTLNNVNDTTFNYSVGITFKAAIYQISGNIYKDTNGSTNGTNIGAVGSYVWLRLERSGNDILFKASPDGTTYTTVSTEVGLVTGVTDLFVKAIFAVNSTTKKMVTTRGLLTVI